MGGLEDPRASAALSGQLNESLPSIKNASNGAQRVQEFSKKASYAAVYSGQHEMKPAPPEYPNPRKGSVGGAQQPMPVHSNASFERNVSPMSKKVPSSYVSSFGNTRVAREPYMAAQQPRGLSKGRGGSTSRNQLGVKVTAGKQNVSQTHEEMIHDSNNISLTRHINATSLIPLCDPESIEELHFLNVAYFKRNKAMLMKLENVSEEGQYEGAKNADRSLELDDNFSVM